MATQELRVSSIVRGSSLWRRGIRFCSISSSLFPWSSSSTCLAGVALGYTTRRESGLFLSYSCRVGGSLGPPISLHNCIYLWASIRLCVSLPVCTVRNQNLPLSFHAPHVFSWTTSSYWIWSAQGYPERQAWIHMCARCPGPCFKMGPVSVKAGLQRVRGGWGMGGGHHSSSPGILWWQRLLGLSLNTGRGGEWQGKGLLTGFSMRTGGSGPPFPHV